MIKEIISIAMSILLSITSIFTGDHNGSINKVQTVSKGEYEYANEIGSEIIRCLKEKDKIALNNLFCHKIKDTEYLQKEIDIIFDYIDNNGGLLIEDSTWSVPTSHGSFNNGRSIAYVSCKYDNTVFINSREYELRFTAYQMLKKHIEYQGIHCIYLIEKVSQEVLDKILAKDEKQKNEKAYLGIDIIYTDNNSCTDVSILPKEILENPLYEIPDNLEDDR